MGKIVSFFGWLMIAIVATLLVFGHIMMVIIYSTDYLIDTLIPQDPKVYSSIWLILATLVPGILFLTIGHLLQKWEQRAEAKGAIAEGVEGTEVIEDDAKPHETPQIES